MRICSLVPVGTQMIYALGLADQLVGVTHHCTDPPEAQAKPVVVRPVLAAPAADPAAVDRAVAAAAGAGAPLYELDEALLKELAPDLLITQSLCDVCAVGTDQAARALAAAGGRAEVVSLHAHSMAEMLDDLRRLGAATGRAAQAGALAGRLEGQLNSVRQAVAGAPTQRALCLEWLDPLYTAGHWMPELIEAAGGQDLLARPGERSRRVEWDQVAAARPDVIILAPCGYGLAGARAQVRLLADRPGWADLPAVRSGRVWVTDANRYFSGAGPRLAEGAAVLAALLHPGRAGHLLPPGAAEPVA